MCSAHTRLPGRHRQVTRSTSVMEDHKIRTRVATSGRKQLSATMVATTHHHLLGLNLILCWASVGLSSLAASADISEIKPLLHRAPQINLTALIQDTRVWNLESLYHMEEPAGGRQKRSAPAPTQTSVDMCQSKMEVLTPYYATNSKGALRTIVNSELMQQAIQVETCTRSPISGAGKCNQQADCGCEQKYKWHRLLALDPKLPAQGLFMDWFLFPSNCVCRCKASNSGLPGVLATKQQPFTRLIKRPQQQVDGHNNDN